MIHERNNFKMGTVEMLVLSLLSQKDLYGYEISLLLKDLSEGSYVVPEGSLYPVLYKLEDKKLITSHAIQTGKRRVRKYYHIETTGLERIKNNNNCEAKRTGTALQSGMCRLFFCYLHPNALGPIHFSPHQRLPQRSARTPALLRRPAALPPPRLPSRRWYRYRR